MSILVLGTILFGIVTNKVPLLCFAVISSFTMSSVKVTVLSASPALIPETIKVAGFSSVLSMFFDISGCNGFFVALVSGIEILLKSFHCNNGVIDSFTKVFTNFSCNIFTFV